MRLYIGMILTLAFIASVINYLDRIALAYAIAPLQKTFALNNGDFGIIAAAFGLGYLCMSVGGGILVDRYGARKIWSLFAIFWSLASVASGLATGFLALIASRVLLGITEAPGFPALARVTADWLPVAQRGRGFALALAAVPLASMIGAPLITYLIVILNWRSMFILLGLIGIVWALIWFVVFKDKPKTQHKGSSQTPTLTSWRFLLFNPVLLINNFAFFAFGYLLFFAINWLPGYLEQEFHMSTKTVGRFLILPWLSATVFILIGGFLTDWLWHKTKSIRTARSHIIWICQILSALCFIPVMLSSSLTVVAIGMSLGVGLGLMPNAAFYALNADIAHDRAATSLGLMNFASASAGILSPLVTGWLTEATGNFFIPFLLMILLSVISALAIFFFQHPDGHPSLTQLQEKPI